jgi:hypothetical protein
VDLKRYHDRVAIGVKSAEGKDCAYKIELISSVLGINDG